MAVMTIDRTAPVPDDSGKRAEALRDLHDQIDPPEGYRVEIVEGEIVVSPSPFGKHALIIADIKRAAASSLPPGLELVERITLEEPELSRYEPDLGLWPRELLNTETGWVFPGNACALAVEVTSPSRRAAGTATGTRRPSASPSPCRSTLR
jgi:Uma2 family endonuclease